MKWFVIGFLVVQVVVYCQGAIIKDPNDEIKPHILINRPRPPMPERFRRDVAEVEEEGNAVEELQRERRWTPNNNQGAGGKGDRGSWGVSVNKDKGRGPQVRTDVGGNIYTSPKGNVRVDGQGHHEFGKGRKPDYGGSINVQGRFRRDTDEHRERREANPQSDKRGSVSVSVNKDRGSGPQVRTDAKYEAWRSKNGNWQLNGGAYHEMGRGRKPSYGGGVTLTGRFRRDLEGESIRERREANPKEDRGSVSVSADHTRGRGPQIRTEGQYKAWESKNGNWQVHGNGFHEAGRGRKPDYGFGATLTGRF